MAHLHFDQSFEGGLVKRLIAPIALMFVISACSSGSRTVPLNYDEWMALYTSQEVSWSECKNENWVAEAERSPLFKTDDVVCADIKVPLEYDPEGSYDDITIRLMKDPASGEKIGTLLSNPGGPGQSGINYVQFVAYPQELRDAYDIVGFDPRGVGLSSPVKCDDDLDLRSYFETHFDPKNEAEYREDKAMTDAYFADCIEKNPTWWAMTTANTVKDIELIRAVLTPNEDLNFIGHSYGTTLAAQYIQNYPDKIGRIILDSPTTSQKRDTEVLVEETKAFVKVRNQIFDRCAKDPDCYGETRKEVEDRLIWARDQVLADKLDGYVTTVVEEDFFKRGTGESAYLIMRALTMISYWPVSDAYGAFKEMMTYLDAGNYGGFEWYGLYLDGYDPETLERDNSFDILQIVNCLDTDERETLSPAELDAQEAALEAADPFTKRFSDIYDYEAPDEAEPGCFWSWEAFKNDEIPDPPAELPEYSNPSGTPVMVIGSKGDTATPYKWSINAAKALQSPLITYEGSGHAVLFGGSDCLEKLAVDYLISGKLPTAATSCPAV
ncbi:MAG: hypothetical protein RIS75_375 [Actinomycetota bacterium]